MSPDRSDEDRVRELLADARHTEPVPDDVAARIDATLAGLREETRAVTPPVPDLASARRRRNVRNLLVAAAAVVVVGVGISRLDLTSTGAESDAGGSSGSSVAGDAPSDELQAGGGRAQKAVGAPVALDPDRFGRQVRRLDRRSSSRPLTSAQADSADGASDGGGAGERSQDFAAWASCDPAGWGPGHRIRARYDGKPGVLVYRRPQGDTQVVDLYLCGHEDPTRSITLSH